MAATQDSRDRDDDGELEELQVAEYVVLLLAVLAYKQYVEARLGEGSEDEHLRQGIKLIRLLDSRHRDAIGALFNEKLSKPTSKAQVNRSFKVTVNNAEQAGRRALSLRAAIRTGGTSVLQALFDESRARRAVKECVAVSYLADTGNALAEYSSHIFRNVRVKAWVKDVREAVAEGAAFVNPVQKAIAAVADQAQSLKAVQVEEDVSADVEDVQEAQVSRTEAIDRLQSEATEAAREAMEATGEVDTPPTKSEVIGIAAAAVAAAVASAVDKSNVPETLRDLDPEQLAAALTDGRVLVAAGAGAGKSTTLVSRVAYLIKERGVDPSRILVSSYNTEAAEELAYKIAGAVGDDSRKAMKVGTLHKVFKSVITDYGEPEEKAMFPNRPPPPRRKPGETGEEQKSENDGILSGTTVAGAVNRIWRKCFATPNDRGTFDDADVPPAKEMLMAKTRWAGNGITPEMAKADAVTDDDRAAALWYEMYEGLKGAIPGWRPSCSGRPDAQYEFDRFMKSHRVKLFRGEAVTVRLGDYDDMISTCREILKRNAVARTSVQNRFDHYMVDECQDLNTVQNDVLMMMTEKVQRDSVDKSFWMVGDDKQSIYDFRGAQPGQFTARAYQADTKLRQMRTNYRCAPEVVDAANRLISHNEKQIKMEANPSPKRPRGKNSIRVNAYEDEASTAIAVADQIKEAWDDGALISEQAVLCRTQKELNAFETALLMRGIPYARRGASSFLSAPDTKAFLGYINLVSESDTEKMQAALVDVINNPNRFFTKIKGDDMRRLIDSAVHNYARKLRIPKKSVNALEALEDYSFQRDILISLRVPPKYMDQGFAVFDDLNVALSQLREVAERENTTTKELFDEVLKMPGVETRINPRTRLSERYVVTFAQSLANKAKDYGGGEDDEDAPPDSGNGAEMRLGNIAFLYELAKPDANDPEDLNMPPTTPQGFWAKMGRLTNKAKELRIDLSKWAREQKDVPYGERQKRPPGVYLGTIHSTKGAQWDNVYLQMPGGRFPLVRQRREEEVTEKTILEDQAKMESERRLAYVAMTRPKQDLRIVAPKVYQGRPAGLSPFVYEAGLDVGENVRKPGEEPEEENNLPPRTAASFVEDYVPVFPIDSMEADYV